MIYKYYTAEVIDDNGVMRGGIAHRFYKWRAPAACHSIMIRSLKQEYPDHLLINFRRIK